MIDKCNKTDVAKVELPEITPEMVEAGVRDLRLCIDPEDGMINDRESAVTSIFLEMMRVAIRQRRIASW